MIRGIGCKEKHTCVENEGWDTKLAGGGEKCQGSLMGRLTTVGRPRKILLRLQN